MKKKLLKTFLFISACTILILTILPIFIDKKKIITAINNKIKNELNLNIDLGEDLKLNFFPFPELQFNNLVFKDESKGLYVKVIEVEIISTWRSIIKLDPYIQEVRLNNPLIQFKNKNIASNLKVLVGNEANDKDLNVKKLFNSFQSLKVKKGNVEFEISGRKHVFENIDLVIKSAGSTQLKANIDYKNLKSLIKLDVRTDNFKDFDYSVNKLFDNKNEIFGLGKIKLEKNKLNIRGNLNSEKLDVDNISKILAFINKPFQRNNIYPVKVMLPKIDINMKLNIDKMIAQETIFKNMYSEILVNEVKVSFRNSRANYLNSTIKANAKYSKVNKKLKGKISIFDYLVEDKLIGNSEFYLKDTSFDCDSEIIVTNKRTKQFLDKFHVTGECISENANIVGINFNKISKKVDNIETFQDFFNLFNKNEMKGNTPLDSINFTFKLKESIFFLNQLEAVQKNIKVLSNGKYYIYDDNLDLKNNIFIKTKKFNNLPSFKVLVNGNSKKYKVSYDFENIKSAILTDGINTILKKQKKIVINPKEFKNLIDKNSKDLKPEKIIDFFLN